MSGKKRGVGNPHPPPSPPKKAVLAQAHRLPVLLGHPGDPVHPPDLGEHGPVAQAEAQGQHPGRHVAGPGEDAAAHEATVQAWEEATHAHTPKKKG